jgi:predicted Na+-dependent transporter
MSKQQQQLTEMELSPQNCAQALALAQALVSGQLVVPPVVLLAAGSVSELQLDRIFE